MRQMYMNAPGIEKQKDGRERKGKERVFATERLMTERDVAVLPFVPSDKFSKSQNKCSLPQFPYL